MSRPALYLDNASTSFPKAPGVAEAVARYLGAVGATPGRGNYSQAREGARIVRLCRERVCRLINGENPDHVVFTLNTTDALNLAIKGVVAHRRRTRPGHPIHLVTSAIDHNSILRPFNALAREGIDWTCIDADKEGFIDPAAVERALRPDTALVALSHASNLTGSIQLVEAVGQLCRRRSVLFLLDGAQSLGHIPVDVRAAGADLFAFPGHKGLLGPLGTGGLYLRPGVEDLVDTIREGGTGTSSERDVQPTALPERFEPGSPNAPGIAGLSQALNWLLEHGAPDSFSAQRALTGAMVEHLKSRGVRTATDRGAPGPSGPLSRFRLLGPTDPSRRVGVFSLVHERIGSHELAAALEASFAVLARPGLHCAPRAHLAMGTTREGALRLSLGPFLTVEDLARACDALAEVGAGFESSGPLARMPSLGAVHSAP